MIKVFWRCALMVGLLSFSLLSLGSPAQAQQTWPLAVDVAVTYTAERAKVAGEDCGCFWLQGGSLDGAVTFFHGLGIVANLTGEHSSNIAPGIDLSKVAFMVGPRYTLNTQRWMTHHSDAHAISIFGEGLFGTAHGFDSVFPSGAGLTSSANSFSMQLGGGMNVRLARGFGLRAFELDYVRTSLPNGSGNAQNDLRLAFGISYHMGGRGAATSDQR
jgi:hypothetical protein